MVPIILVIVNTPRKMGTVLRFLALALPIIWSVRFLIGGGEWINLAGGNERARFIDAATTSGLAIATLFLLVPASEKDVRRNIWGHFPV